MQLLVLRSFSLLGLKFHNEDLAASAMKNNILILNLLSKINIMVPRSSPFDM